MVSPPQVCGRPGCLEQAYRNGPPLLVGDPAKLEPHLPHLRMAESRYFGSRPRFVRGRSVTNRMSSIVSLDRIGVQSPGEINSPKPPRWPGLNSRQPHRDPRRTIARTFAARQYDRSAGTPAANSIPVSYTHLTLPTI